MTEQGISRAETERMEQEAKECEEFSKSLPDWMEYI
jgi:hypothetical protein